MVAKVDGNTVRSERTRERILAASLRLFNEEGEGRVTTGAIAAELGISPGNLYYHFRGKDQIVERLFARLEERVDVGVAPASTGAAAVEDLWLYLHLTLEAIWAHRFLYRNLSALLARNPRLRVRFARLIGRQATTLSTLCQSLVAARAMRASPAEIQALANNALVLATFWLDFHALTGLRARGDDEAAGALGAAAFRVMALFGPYLRGAARRHLDGLARGYLS